MSTVETTAGNSSIYFSAFSSEISQIVHAKKFAAISSVITWRIITLGHKQATC